MEAGSLKVWTLIILGGKPIHLRLQGGRLGPALEHSGHRTVWKMVGTVAEAEAAKALLAGPLVGAQVTLCTEEETEEMLQIRYQGE